MARQHRRQKQDVQHAVTESETRVRADIKAVSDQLSRRSLLERLAILGGLAGLAGLGVTVLAWIFPRQRQVGLDVTHHRVNLSMSASAGLPSATFRLRARVVPAEQTRSV